MNTLQIQISWSLLQEILGELAFSSQQMEQVQTDLTTLISAELIVELLQKLPESQQAELRMSVAELGEQDQQARVQTFLQNTYTKDEIDHTLTVVTQKTLLSYVDEILGTLSEEKKAIIAKKLIRTA